ncbi:class I SAM-dependent RNA methyltransferase [Sphingomonas psychrolutea]|uniref:RNA methyltransferase n=1 Tax=Sphingomonas psychrolutea TaxID=1259676 RepID=A0ABQ1GZG8_9SPHN|nr:class I SAM-dependent RNA methyltransferase [Sphingomonas psychrolutea]GGA52864.1 RNA methyltransferase [Sphingomonas psychrolutea]
MSDLIVRVAARGEGVTADGRHAAFAAPGDTLTPENIVLPGPHQQAPPCRHFPQCGGCQLQHLDDESYAAFLTDRITGALAAQGVAAPIRPPALSPPRTRRRAALQAESKGGAVTLGFSEGASHNIVDLRDCWILTPALFAVIAPLRKLLARVLKGRARIHLTEIDQGVDVLIEGKIADGLAAIEAVTAFCLANQIARLAIDDGIGPETRWEPDGVTITLGGVAVPFPAGSFLQATREGEGALVAAVKEAVGGATVCADLFAGLGTFALSLPGKVYAAEAGRDVVLALQAGAARAGRAVFAEHRDLFRRPLTAAECDRFHAIILDPPRAGAKEQISQLAASNVPIIAYVSCNPSSFARDTDILCKGGYTLDWVQPVGQFRWSTHVELAGRFRRT